MRISDWSSDVCSSDLFALVPGVAAADRQAEPVGEIEGRIAEYGEGRGVDIGLGKGGQPGEGVEDAHVEQGVGARVEIIEAEQRSEERRVGKEGGRTCRSGWSPDHQKKK